MKPSAPRAHGSALGFRDRDALPTLPPIPLHVAKLESPDLDMRSLRTVLDNANDTVRRVRGWSCGNVVPNIGGPARGLDDATGQQQEVARGILHLCSEWRADLEAVPSSSEALRLAGGLSLGVYATANPTDFGAQADGRLPKGAVRPIDVERLSLPPEGTVPVQLADVSPTACAYLSKFRKRMLKTDDHVDWARYRTQRTGTDEVLRKKDDLLWLFEHMWKAWMLDFTSESRSEVRAFFVVKGYKEPGEISIRAVLDERKPNLLWQETPFIH
jgi:hypothetical protein